MWSSNAEAEMSVLGAAIIDDKASVNVCKSLAQSDFASAANAGVFRAMQNLYRAGRPIDLTTVTEELYRMDAMEAIGGVLYLTQLCRHVPTTVNHPSYIRIVKERAARRIADKVAEAIKLAVQDEGRDITAIRDQALAALTAIRPTEDGKEDPSAAAILTAAMQYAEARANAGDLNLTGIPDIDRAMGGLHPGELTILAARPAEGKSTLAWQIGEQFARRGQRVLFVSCEMSHSQLGVRWLAMHGVNSERIRAGKPTPADWDDITSATGELSKLPMEGHTTLRRPRDISALIKERLEAGGVGLVIVDYLQLLVLDRSAGNRTTEITQISRDLKLMTLEYKLPLLVLSQLSRAPENRASRMPTLSDLRDSGSIEQDADNVIFLMRPKKADDVPLCDREEYESIAQGGNSMTYCSIAKQRNGPAMECKLLFCPSQMRMYSLTYDFTPVDHRQTEMEAGA